MTMSWRRLDISAISSRLLKLLFEMFKKEGEFELKDQTGIWKRNWKRIFVNGDHYSFWQLKNREYHIKQAAEKPSTALKGFVFAYHLEIERHLGT